jgi:membrane fusion protein (multidrug efflux system)
MIRKKFFIVGLFILILSAFGIKHFRRTLPLQQDATVVEVIRVQQGSIPIEVQAIGTLVAAQNVQIAPETAGQVAKIFFQDGVFVTRGTPLIQLNNAEYLAKLASAKADLNLSTTTYERLKVLAKQGIISRQDLEKSLADMLGKKATAEENNVMLNKMLIVAPFDGVLGKSLVSVGNYVSTGQSLVSLTDTHHLHVEYSIPEKFFGALKLGQTISVLSSAFPQQEFTGKVAYIAPTINTQDRTVSLYAEVPNNNQLLASGLFVTVRQNLGENTHALLVPPTSLLGTIDGQEIFTVVDGKAKAVVVEVGQRTPTSVEILTGLATNDLVVVAGQQKLHDGALVQIKK